MIILTVSESEAGLCDWPSNDSYCNKLWWVLIRPIAILLAATIPSCHSEYCKRFYMVTFFMCIVWIGVTSYMVSWMITIIGMQKNKMLPSKSNIVYVIILKKKILILPYRFNVKIHRNITILYASQFNSFVMRLKLTTN
jgi:hypothetical protein